MDKVKGDAKKALFYVAQTIENGWSRSMLLNWIGTGLYERQGKALNNFTHSLPKIDSDLAKEITKDPIALVLQKLQENIMSVNLKMRC